MSGISTRPLRISSRTARNVATTCERLVEFLKTETNETLVFLIKTLNKLEKGYYELKRTKDNTYHVVLYNNTDYGVYAAIYNEKQ